jgi:Flp pilus assembly protein TadG
MPGPRIRRRARASQSGAAAVEFGLVVLPLMLLLFGIIQYGFYFWSMQAGSAAVRDAAREAAVGNLTCSELTTYVKARLDPSRDTSKAIAVERDFIPEDAPTIGDTVRITVDFNSHYFGLVPVPDGAAVHQSADSRVENVRAGSGADVPCP